MVTWKAALIVVVIGILFMAIGFWLGYRYISEQDPIHYEAQFIHSHGKSPLHACTVIIPRLFISSNFV